MSNLRGRRSLGSFNPRTREGCDLKSIMTHFAKHKFQSTHPRGVRLYTIRNTQSINPFQSTHPRGVRPFDAIKLPSSVGFNPRTREGCDKRKMILYTRLYLFQSTHPRGVRLTVLVRCKAVSSFNPRTREGCDHEYSGHTCHYTCFNPRTREGCDKHYAPHDIEVRVSIHAPARGATPDRLQF